MPDLIANGAAWLAEQRKAHLSKEIAYVVGAVSTPMLATIGRTEFEVVGEGGVMERVESRDFIVATADLPATPERGHRIHETVGEQVHVFEVMAPVRSAPAWRWADAQRTAWRIHTRLVSKEDA
jgi:hypothetical protein